MVSQLLLSVLGFVRIRITGKRGGGLPAGALEAFMNGAMNKKLTIWDIEKVRSGEAAELCMPLRDYVRIRTLLKQTGCRARVLERRGTPFVLGKLMRRKVLAAGILLFVIGIYALSSVVWRVDIVGNESISDDAARQAAYAAGIRPLQLKHRLQDPDRLSRQMQTQLPGAAWIGVTIDGTRVSIKIVEATIPNKPPLMNPRHLVADSDAVITSILAERGRPLVKPNQHVRKGDVLISGIIGDEQTQQTVPAKGEVRGLVWHQFDMEAPLTKRYKVYSGEERTRQYLVIGNRALQLTGYGKLPYAYAEVLQERSGLAWRKWAIPLGWLTETVKEYELVEQKVDTAEAKANALLHARAEAAGADGKAGAVVRGENILHEKTENGKVYMTVLFEVDEPIAVELPIIPQPTP